MSFPKCLQCVSEEVAFESRQMRGILQDGEVRPMPRDAITMAPSWQQQTQMGPGQMAIACVAIPSCKEHLQVQEISAIDRAIMGGKLILGGQG